MKTLIPIALALALVSTACGSGGGASTALTPTPTSVTETFTGSVDVGGVDFKTFTVKVAGNLSVTLTAAGPPTTIFMGLGIGTVSASTCSLLSGATVIAPAGTTAQLSGSLSSGGDYCVAVYDVGNQTAPIDYSVTVSHS